MFYGVSHVDLSVSNLARSRRFYSEGLGFAVVREGAGFCDLDAHSLQLRLIESRAIEYRCAIRLQVPNVEAAWQRLVELGGKALYEPARTEQLELVGSTSDPDGHCLTVWRNMSEDEYGFLPSLPKEQSWSGEAEKLLQSLLTRVPSLFRGLARRKVVREAEELAVGRDVGRDDVIRAYIRSNAKITRYRVKAPLIEHGVDPEQYRADFEW
jgi:catechol 2,3-dioxygenase-like lactoylglutathione lyase family enzyme